MCALLAPILKSGYNLFTPAFSRQKSKHCDRSTGSERKNGHNLDQLMENNRRARTKSEHSQITASVSTPSIMQQCARRSKSTVGPPPVDNNRRRSALSTSQYYLQQRRELAKQQQAKRELAQKQFLEQQKHHVRSEKQSSGKIDKKRS